MLCSLSIVDTALKKVSKITDKLKKKENTELLELSICQHYTILNQEMDKIFSHIYEDTESYNKTNNMINKYKELIDYHPDEIELMKCVVKRLYKYGKYYLD